MRGTRFRRHAPVRAKLDPHRGQFVKHKARNGQHGCQRANSGGFFGLVERFLQCCFDSSVSCSSGGLCLTDGSARRFENLRVVVRAEIAKFLACLLGINLAVMKFVAERNQSTVVVPSRTKVQDLLSSFSFRDVGLELLAFVWKHVVWRAIAVLLMIGGISLVGSITATLASWIVQRVADEDVVKQAATAAHLDTLRTDLERDIFSLRKELRSIAETLTDQRSKRDQ
jgi:hypothetical protein